MTTMALGVPLLAAPWLAAPSWARCAIVDGLLAEQGLRTRMHNKALDRQERARR